MVLHHLAIPTNSIPSGVQTPDLPVIRPCAGIHRFQIREAFGAPIGHGAPKHPVQPVMSKLKGDERRHETVKGLDTGVEQLLTETPNSLPCSNTF